MNKKVLFDPYIISPFEVNLKTYDQAPIKHDPDPSKQEFKTSLFAIMRI